MKSPNLTKNKPTHTTTKNNHSAGLANPQITYTCRPNPTGQKQADTTKNSYKTRIKSRTITSKHHLQLEVHKQRHRHTPTTQNVQPAQHRHATNPQTKVHWHTCANVLLFVDWLRACVVLAARFVWLVCAGGAACEPLVAGGVCWLWCVI